MKYTQKERRRGSSNRRKAGNWIRWAILLGAVLMASAGGYGGYKIGRDTQPQQVFVLDSAMIREANETQEELRHLASLVPDTVPRYVIRDRWRIDSFPMPYAVIGACVPEIVEVASPPVVVYDTTTIYQQAKIQLCPERTFWSSETYRPSIGNTLWSLGGFVAGIIVGGQLNNDARACVIVNGEEVVCEYQQ